jgi:putative membrane protein insertion efficiency factor
MQGFFRAGRLAAHLAIRAYQLSFSPIVGIHCRHLPTCSAYMDEAIARHGLWAGGWLGLARLLRCHPWGTSGFDPVPERLPRRARWFLPWTYLARSREEQEVEM